jgi:hypothetical protein
MVPEQVHWLASVAMVAASVEAPGFRNFTNY